MRQLQIGILGLLAFWLIADGSPVSLERVQDEMPVAASSTRAAKPLHLEAKLRELNPLLSDREVGRIVAAVQRCESTYGLAPDLVAGVMVRESSARPWVVSSKGAVGLMQVMPHMYSLYGLAGNITTIESNIEAGCVILSDNIRRRGEDEGILTYFWGERIRGVSYLEGVREARAWLRQPPGSRS